MNRRMVCQLVGRALLIQAVLLLLPGLVAVACHERAACFWLSALVTAAAGGTLLLFRPLTTAIYAREGFVSVSLSWLALSLTGSLPFLFSGAIPAPVDALFETVSGLTTTGASILTDIDGLPRGILFWRSLTHWIGGMGVLVFVMAVLPMAGGRALHVMRAEMPGPTVGKLAPRARRSAMLLYLIYVGLTLAETLCLLACGLSPYDAVTHAMATAGTGGFSTYSAGVAVFPDSAQLVIAVFMLLFGVNFNLFYLLLLKQFRTALKNEELRWYGLIVAFATVTIAFSIRGLYTEGRPLLDAFFQVASIITTTGFATADFNLWPAYARWLLLALMVVGACAGSTGGGMKVSRLIIMAKAARVEARRMLRPNLVYGVRVAGDSVKERTQQEVFAFAFLYALLLLLGSLLLSLDGFGLATTFSAALACLSNIGPGLGLVGPMGGYAIFSAPAKLLLAALMLLGRLEIWPFLILATSAKNS